VAVQIVEVKEAQTEAMICQVSPTIWQGYVLILDDFPNWGSSRVTNKQI
jgi:hypothetical protein